MIAFLLLVLGLAFHVLALFMAFGCGVEMEGKKGRSSDEAIGFYVLICFGAFAIGIILIVASTKVS